MAFNINLAYIIEFLINQAEDSLTITNLYASACFTDRVTAKAAQQIHYRGHRKAMQSLQTYGKATMQSCAPTNDGFRAGEFINLATALESR